MIIRRNNLYFFLFIYCFREENKMKIAVAGTGYVGLVIATLISTT